MTRRQHLQLLAAGALGAAPAREDFDGFFFEIVRGFVRNARATSPSYAVCDFPDGTKLKTCLAHSGKTYIGVARMLPALASFRAAGRNIPGIDLDAILLAIFRHSFDPAHPDYWEEPPPDRVNQRQVEASLVAWSLWRLGDRFLARLTPRERANVQAWLASCTRVVERKHNHAWFSAINHAGRLALAPRWKEFSGDEAWMLEDLAALDAMGSPGDGWYSDSLTLPIFDYYNFWTFASHFLQWNQMIGARYPRLAARFAERLRPFLEKTPHFFGANGCHALMGRSLIYRWGVLTPLVEAYEQKLWPHSPGLLRAIVRRSLDFHRAIGSYDAEAGKLRETYSAGGTRSVREMYIDNGHPYWSMQAYSFLALPRTDPFWSAPEEPLPIDRGDFLVRFEGPRMLLAGARDSGQVRWIQAQPAYHHLRYRDKYIKFSYSSHFAFNILPEEDRCPWDNALVFRNPATGHMAARAQSKGELTRDGVRTQWRTELDGRTIEVVTTLRLAGEFEARVHEVRGAGGFEVLEGGCALGLEDGEEPRGAHSLTARNGYMIAAWNLGGFDSLTVETVSGANVIWPRAAVLTLRAKGADQMTLRSLHYASPKPLAALEDRAREIRKSLA